MVISIKNLLTIKIITTLFLCNLLYSKPIGIVGGENKRGSNPAYAAFIHKDGILIPLAGGSFPSTSGVIFSADINRSGVGIIGGNYFTASTAA